MRRRFLFLGLIGLLLLVLAIAGQERVRPYRSVVVLPEIAREVPAESAGKVSGAKKSADRRPSSLEIEPVTEAELKAPAAGF